MTLSRELKVGLFVFLGLAAAASIIFLIGDNRSLFDSKVEYLVQFENVQGVKPGSTVRMGGVDIGTVSSVSYPDDASRSLIDVELSIVKREAKRIRQGSEANIAAKGLLGDKMVTITPGLPNQPAIPAGGTIPSAPTDDFTQLFSKLDSMTGTAQSVLSNLEDATGTLADQELQADVKRGVTALSNLLVALDSGNGYAARLLHDEAEARRLSGVIEQLERTTARLDRVLAGVDEMVARINTGPGLAHELLYGESGTRAVAQLGNAAEELALVLDGIQQGNGLARGLLFGSNGEGGDSALGDKVADDLSAMSSDLREMVGNLRQGKGTLGALLVDPSVYEDLKMLLGNVQRNQTLRALVRYSIRRDDASGVEVVDPEPPATRDARRGSGPAAPEGGAAAARP